MTCDAWRQKTDAYLDGELPEAEVRDLDAHLHDCPDCASQALLHSQLKRSIRFAGNTFAPSPEFRQQIESSIRKKSTRRQWGWMPQFGLALATMLLLVVGSMLWLRHRESNQVVGELTDLHIATLASANPVDVISTDRHTVKPWFQGKVPFTFNLPELQGSSFELIGGRMTYLDQNPGAELLFRVRKHLLSVFIFKDSTELDRALGTSGVTRRLSFNLASWTDEGLRYVVVTDASRSDVDDLRARFAEAH
jgi:anti-sigma factor RsiW